MNLTDNFVALVRPINLYESLFKVNWDTSRKRFEVFDGRPSSRATSYFETELDMWKEVAEIQPTLVVDLANSVYVLTRALSRRAELFLTLGPSAVEAMEAVLHGTVVTMHDEVIRSLDARRITRAKPSIRRTKPSTNISMLAQTSKVELPFIPGEESLLVVNAIPSPVDASVWSMSVRMPTKSNEDIFIAQQRIAAARERLASEGIIISDAISGTGYAEFI